jgi:hypothetical protein
MGVPATNRNVEFTATGILRFNNGMMAEEWVDMNALGLLQQLGALNPPE